MLLSSASESAARVQDWAILQQFRKKFYHYHLTLNEEGNPRWICKTIDFASCQPGERLTTTTVVLPDLPGGRKPDRREHVYEVEASIEGHHLIMKKYRAGGRAERADTSIEVYPYVDQVDPVHFPRSLYSVRINRTWHDRTFASSIGILTRQPFEGAEQDGPIMSQSIADALQAEWDTFATAGGIQGSIRRLPFSSKANAALGVLPAFPQDELNTLLRGPYHHYHVTAREGERFWLYSELKFGSGSLSGTARTVSSHSFDDSIEVAFGLRAVRLGDILLLMEDSDGDNPVSYVSVFPFFWKFGKGHRTVSHGLAFHYTYDGRPEFAPCLLSPKALLTEVSEGRVPPSHEPTLETAWAKKMKSTPFSSAAAPENSGSRAQKDLSDLLNSCFQSLNDSTFGSEVAQYLLSELHNGVFCHDLNTTFTFHHVEPTRFRSIVDNGNSNLMRTCFDLTIREQVDKVCSAETVWFAVFLDLNRLPYHFAKKDYDFVWCIDLPEDANFQGKTSDIFIIDWIEIEGQRLEPETVVDGPREFTFKVNVANLSRGNPLMHLRYQFHTLKAKDYRHVSYGTRFLTRNMKTRVEFGHETGINSVVMVAEIAGKQKPKPSDFGFETRELAVGGWLLPRSGVTFSFRYDETYR